MIGHGSKMEILTLPIDFNIDDAGADVQAANMYPPAGGKHITFIADHK